jgi:hypothetical protein
MHTYRLKLPDDGTHCARDVEFEADTGLTAMTIAHQQARHRAAELWCDGQFICTIEEAAEGFWRLAPAADKPRDSEVAQLPPRGREPTRRQQFKRAGEVLGDAPRKRRRLHLNFG